MYKLRSIPLSILAAALAAGATGTEATTSTTGAGGSSAAVAASSTASTTSASVTSSTTGSGSSCPVEAPQIVSTCDPAAQCDLDTECPDGAYCDGYYPDGGGCVGADKCGHGQCFTQGDIDTPCIADNQCLASCGLACDPATGTCGVVDDAAYAACGK